MLHSFSGSGDGANPFASVIESSDGLFYGTTAGYSFGKVYAIDSSGQLETIFSFPGSHNGAKYPRGKLIQDADGAFYGTTTDGGGTTRGTVFKLTTDGVLTILHVFDQIDGQNPTAGLTIGADGAFYGSTPTGGLQMGKGTIFRVTPEGDFTVLHKFTGEDGSEPNGELLLGKDGDLYGTTMIGGNGFGTIFKITSDGVLTTLYRFAGSDGSNPTAGLIQASDGDFYGTTVAGGASIYGTVYKFDSAGVLTTLHSFSQTDGAYPEAPLVQANDGNFYGTTLGLVVGNYGTVFELTPEGGFATIHRFANLDGASPYAGLLQGSDGDLYGTTFQGGAYGIGTVFRLSLPLTPPTPPPTPTPTPPPTPTPQLKNISTRLSVLQGDKVLIGGFIVTGDAPKKVILRAIGPSLVDFGLTDVLTDPMLELHAPDMTVMTNDNWKETQESEIEAAGFAPSREEESAIITTLSPGAYTAIVSGKDGGTGVGLVEIYDLDQTTDSALANISTRGFVDRNDNVMIGGVIVGGETSQVLVRAIGPALIPFGVEDALEDTTLELRDKDGALITSNDDWKESQQAEIAATGLAPTDDRESSILATLVPDSYTAIVRGKDDTTGVGLVEVYNVSP